MQCVSLRRGVWFALTIEISREPSVRPLTVAATTTRASLTPAGNETGCVTLTSLIGSCRYRAS